MAEATFSKKVQDVLLAKFQSERGPIHVAAITLSSVVVASVWSTMRSVKRDVVTEIPSTKKKDDNPKKDKIGINKEFFRRFKKLLNIALPSLNSNEGAILFVLSVLLLMRTALTLKISAITGHLAKFMVKTEAKPFILAIASLAAWAVPASLTNSGLKYCTAKLEVSFRKSLTKHIHRRYFHHRTFFRCVGLGSIQSIDQRICQDVKKWSEEAADIYTTLFKPLIDIIFFSRKVAENGGYKGPGLILGYYAFITVLIRSIAPNIGKYTALQQQKEALFRTGHARLISHAEEVAFYGGNEAERSVLDGLFRMIHLNKSYTTYLKASYNILEAMVVKYGSVMVGYCVCAMSTFSEEASKLDASELTGLYIHNSQLLVNLARATGQFIMTQKKLASLSGYTMLVTEVLDGIAAEEKKAELAATSRRGGEVVIKDNILFDKVPVISPTRTTLIESLSFRANPGMNVLIVGPNGCGKSSTFRLLGELWPLESGRIEKPPFEKLYYVPQRPYMSSGTLRDQVIYPASAKDIKGGDAELLTCLERAHLANILDKDGVSWGARSNWAGEALSHGEKQKMAMARLYYHRPRFAILDECSSAVDLDVEEALYKNCKELGITVLTIAHRHSVWKHHNWVLRFDGNNGYAFSPLRFDSAGQMILTRVESASDESLLGKEMVVAAPTVRAEDNEAVQEEREGPF